MPDILIALFWMGLLAVDLWLAFKARRVLWRDDASKQMLKTLHGLVEKLNKLEKRMNDEPE